MLNETVVITTGPSTVFSHEGGTVSLSSTNALKIKHSPIGSFVHMKVSSKNKELNLIRTTVNTALLNQPHSSVKDGKVINDDLKIFVNLSPPEAKSKFGILELAAGFALGKLTN